MTPISPHPADLPVQVFVVDDEPLLTELAEVVLTRAGLRVRTFNDPADAAREFAAASPKPGVLVTDFAMGTMNGLELIEQCRHLDSQLHVILASGTVDESITAGTTEPIQQFLRKPYNPMKLVNKILELLAK